MASIFRLLVLVGFMALGVMFLLFGPESRSEKIRRLHYEKLQDEWLKRRAEALKIEAKERDDWRVLYKEPKCRKVCTNKCVKANTTDDGKCTREDFVGGQLTPVTGCKDDCKLWCKKYCGGWDPPQLRFRDIDMYPPMKCNMHRVEQIEQKL